MSEGNQTETSENRFEAWGVVDLFGHTRLAGRISEQTIGGETFIRVDVPTGAAGESFHTRLYGKGAIYGITLTDERIAREVAKAHQPRPVSLYDVPQLVKEIRDNVMRPRMLGGGPIDDDDDPEL